MNAAESIINEVRAAGGNVIFRDGKLRLTAPAPLPQTIIDRVREAKPILLAALRPAWDATDWQVFYDERAGIAEHDGKQPRDEAERMAYEHCIVRWLHQNPTQHDDDNVCPYCLKSTDRTSKPVLNGRGGHVWIHDGCHEPYIAHRRQDAVAELKAMEIFSVPGSKQIRSLAIASARRLRCLSVKRLLLVLGIMTYKGKIGSAPHIRLLCRTFADNCTVNISKNRDMSSSLALLVFSSIAVASSE